MPSLIAVGADGALWFTENVGNRIGRITTGGEVRQHLIATPESGPVGIAAGADGAIWFAELQAGQIGRIDAGRRGRRVRAAGARLEAARDRARAGRRALVHGVGREPHRAHLDGR